MLKRIKPILLIILLIVLIAGFSSSYKIANIDNVAIVVAMGIDKSLDNENQIDVTFQFTNPNSVSESGSSEQSPSILETVTASSISSAINLMNTNIGKEVTLSHCKLIVFSEEIAKNDISDEIYTLMNDTQVRPSSNIVISKCPAEYYISNSKPLLEPLISKYYELFVNSSQYTGYTSNATIGRFFDRMICHSCEPSAILGGINLQLEDTTQDISTSNPEAINKSNSASLSGSTASENVGLAVFNGGSLVR